MLLTEIEDILSVSYEETFSKTVGMDFFNVKYDGMEAYFTIVAQFVGTKPGYQANQDIVIIQVNPEVAKIIKDIEDNLLDTLPADPNTEYKHYSLVFNSEIKLKLLHEDEEYTNARCNFTPSGLGNLAYGSSITVNASFGWYRNKRTDNAATQGLFLRLKDVRTVGNTGGSRRRK